MSKNKKSIESEIYYLDIKPSRIKYCAELFLRSLNSIVCEKERIATYQKIFNVTSILTGIDLIILRKTHLHHNKILMLIGRAMLEMPELNTMRVMEGDFIWSFKNDVIIFKANPQDKKLAGTNSEILFSDDIIDAIIPKPKSKPLEVYIGQGIMPDNIAELLRSAEIKIPKERQYAMIDISKFL